MRLFNTRLPTDVTPYANIRATYPFHTTADRILATLKPCCRTTARHSGGNG